MNDGIVMGVHMAWPTERLPATCADSAKLPAAANDAEPAVARIRFRDKRLAVQSMRTMDGRPDVLVGPRFRLPPDPLVGCSPWSEPRLCIAGRWVSAMRASHQLWVSKVLPHRMTVADRRANTRYRISVRLGRFDDCPF
jgi:hypothetical protein